MGHSIGWFNGIASGYWQHNNHRMLPLLGWSSAACRRSLETEVIALARRAREFAHALYTAVLGLHFEREQQKKNGQLAIF
jgi:hypothetical protein